MFRTATRPWPQPRDRSLVYADHPTFGYYVYAPSTGRWAQARGRPDAPDFVLRCRERAPSDQSIQTWQQIEARLPELEAAAVASVGDPPVRAKGARFDRRHLSLRAVEIDDAHNFVFFFDTPLGDEIDMWPMVTFADWAVRRSEWVP